MAIDTSFLKKLDRFDLILQRKVNSNYMGERRSEAHGSGIILKDYVQYTPGDDFRRIDWRVFARTDKLYSRRFEEERNLTLHVIIDSSASMNFGKPKKFEYASMLGLGFAYISLRNNERFVISTFAEKLEFIRPKKGMRQLASVVQVLNDKRPSGSSELSAAMRRYQKRMVRSHSLIVIISDFLYDLEQIKATLATFQGHEVTLVQVLDEVEATLDLSGDFRLVDSESQETMRTYISPLLRKKYGEMMEDHQGKIKDACAQYGAKFFSSTNSDDIFDTFFKILG
ncbi:MAG TPA: DUF58 domain-containing protein [Candidatus Nanoarchaeia archaeon]|nr:DUF58 domain-containing protein [Candidatus Nanoarchaeia archaeon]